MYFGEKKIVDDLCYMFFSLNTLNIKRNVSKKCFVFLFRQKVIEYACSYEKVDKTQQKYNITKEK